MNKQKYLFLSVFFHFYWFSKKEFFFSEIFSIFFFLQFGRNAMQ